MKKIQQVLANPSQAKGSATNERPTPPKQNPDPLLPTTDTLKKLPPTIQTLVRQVVTNGLPRALCDYIMVDRWYGRCIERRVLNLCERGMAAVLAWLFVRMNLSTLQCHTDGKRLAKLCRLSESQISRHINTLERIGMITREVYRGPFGLYLPQRITIHTKLLEVFGIGPDRLDVLQKQHARYAKDANRQPLSMVSYAKKVVRKAVSAMEQAFKAVKEKAEPPRPFFTIIKRDSVVAKAEVTESLLRTFRLGRYGPTFSTA